MTAYNKLKWDASVELLGPLRPRAALAQASAGFYDPSLTDWLVKETAAAPDAASKLLPIEAALKVMPQNKKDAVGAALQKAKAELPGDVFQASKQMFDFASQTLEQMREQTAAAIWECSISQSLHHRRPRMARNQGFLDDGHLRPGQSRCDPQRASQAGRENQGSSARLAVVEAIDELAPKGDVRAADALDTMVAADKRSGEQGVLMADDSVVKIALRLRARAP